MPALEGDDTKGSVGGVMREHSNKKDRKRGHGFCRLEGIIATHTSQTGSNQLCRLRPSFEVGAQPLQTLVKAVTTRGASGLR